MFVLYCIIVSFIVFWLYYCTFWVLHYATCICLGYWAIFSNPAVQLQVCHKKVELSCWLFWVFSWSCTTVADNAARNGSDNLSDYQYRLDILKTQPERSKNSPPQARMALRVQSSTSSLMWAGSVVTPAQQRSQVISRSEHPRARLPECTFFLKILTTFLVVALKTQRPPTPLRLLYR